MGQRVGFIDLEEEDEVAMELLGQEEDQEYSQGNLLPKPPPVPPNPHWIPLHLYIKTTITTLNKRLIVLHESMPLGNTEFKEFHDTAKTFVPLFKEKLHNSNVPIISKLFLCDVLLSGSRLWDLFGTLIENSSPGEIQIDKLFGKLESDWKNMTSIFYAIDLLKIVPLQEEWIQHCAHNMLNHFHIIQVIEPRICLSEFMDLLDATKYYWFYGQGLDLFGMSSWDGMRVYINVLEGPHLDQQSQWMVTLEHEVVDNVSRWKDKKDSYAANRISICSSYNMALKSRSGEIVEAGFFYEEQIYGYDTVYTNQNRKPSLFSTKTKRMD
eukprot:TRINITY_DN22509_c0_g1_i1.p1 TRINITY_DN22509_c0_g1~~TRINITY_DN22509_c0_g1_i1.p1  ORF type:complete len:325 (+),score=84.24 TRINITY_DN22509_c0_g1_i1:27-1001(+)